MEMHLAISLVSLGIAVAALASSLLWRRSHVIHALRAELEQALIENRRWAEERHQLQEQLKAAKARVTSETLDAHATRAVAYAESVGGSGADKLRHALSASKKFDVDANGTQDWSDSQHRIAIEAAVARLHAR